MLQLDARLALAEDLLGRCETLYDIGSNHGFLAVHMLWTGRCRRAVLCDISANALSRARGLVARAGLADRAAFAVTDGFAGLDPQPGDAAAILGMGGRTIAAILREGLPCPVVLQANVEIACARRRVEQAGMHIAREGVARAAGRLYVVMRAEPGPAAPMSEAELRLGPALLRDKPAGAREYLLWRQRVAARALEGARLGTDAEKLRRAEAEFACIEAALRRLEEEEA